MKKITIQLLLIFMLGIFSACFSQEEVNYLEETQENKNARMQWWEDARFGMFIHWGLYAVPAGEYRGQQIQGIGEWIMHRANIPRDEYLL